eukprot:m.130906 g.130906  ORF g.130906 m.130906 type:complete len:685 (+) comp29510_c0_seq1:158-2212(+)
MASFRSMASVAVGAAGVVGGLGYVGMIEATDVIPRLALGFIVASSITACWWITKRSIVLLAPTKQLRVKSFMDTDVYNGPARVFLNPFGYLSFQIVTAETLGQMDYIRVQNTVTAEERIDRGPKLLFLGKHDSITIPKTQALTLQQTEYIHVENSITGDVSMVKGPAVWFPGPYSKVLERKNAITLAADEYVNIKDTTTGTITMRKGPDLLFLPRASQADTVRQAFTLKSTQYVRLLDSITGVVTVHRGEAVLFPEPTQTPVDPVPVQSALQLKTNEYVKILNQATAERRVIKGPGQVFLGASDEIILDCNTIPPTSGQWDRRSASSNNNTVKPSTAVEVDDEHAVLVRDKLTGQLRLVTQKELFFPGVDEEIVKIQERFRLADHEAMIIKDQSGELQFHYGNTEKETKEAPRSFFLQPYSEVVELWWSSGLRRESKTLCIKRFDCRPQYMWFEFVCRTQDNVELCLECTFYYEVVNLPLMVGRTGDLPGDIYNQARSQFMKQVAKLTLKEFMTTLHTVSKNVFEENVTFYSDRGVNINSLEVTKYACVDKKTSEVLQQIITETTNRLNRLSQAEGDTEVAMHSMKAQIEKEKLNSDLLEIKQNHTKAEARVKGEAEAAEVASFIQGLETEVPDLAQRVAMWNVLRKEDALAVIAKGNTSLYYTPNDVDLSIHANTTTQTKRDK